MDDQTKVKGVSLEDLQIAVQDVFNKGFGNVGTCSTAAGTAAKTVTLGTIFSLETGCMMLIKFTNGISSENSTLAVTHTTLAGTQTTEAAKPIYLNGAALEANIISAGAILILRYNGSQFDIIGGGGQASDAYTKAQTNALLNVKADKTVVDGMERQIEQIADLSPDISALQDSLQAFYLQLNNNKADKGTTLSDYGITDAYTKGAVDNMIAGLNGNVIPVATRPATGNANTIYRVAGSSTYTDWMYYGGSWIKLAELSNNPTYDTPIDFNLLFQLSGWIRGDNGYPTVNDAYSHSRALDLKNVLSVKIKANASRSSYIAWATIVSGNTWGGVLNNQRIEIPTNTEQTLTVPSGAKYLIIGEQSLEGSGNVYTPQSVIVSKSIGAVLDQINHTTRSISPAGSLDNMFYDMTDEKIIYDTQPGACLLYFNVIAGERIKIHYQTPDSNPHFSTCFFYPTIVTNNLSIPRSQIYTTDPTTVSTYDWELTAPYSGYLYIGHVLGTTFASTVQIVGKKDIDDVEEKLENEISGLSDRIDGLSISQYGLSKLTYLHWNIAHFNLGSGITNSIDTLEKYNTYKYIYRNILNKANADIIGISEYESPFYKNHSDYPTDVEVFGNYKYHFDINSPNNYGMWLALFSQLPVQNVVKVDFSVYKANEPRYYMVGDVYIGEKIVKIVVVHATYDANEVYAPQQLQQLREDMSIFSYVVIMGDLNCNNAQIELFSQAGYNVLNHGYLGDFDTTPGFDYFDNTLDNIMVKGGKLNNIQVINTNEGQNPILSDHLPVMCDIVF